MNSLFAIIAVKRGGIIAVVVAEGNVKLVLPCWSLGVVVMGETLRIIAWVYSHAPGGRPCYKEGDLHCDWFAKQINTSKVANPDPVKLVNREMN